MERTQLFDLMDGLKLYGMKAAFDGIMTTAVKRQHEPQRIVGRDRDAGRIAFQSAFIYTLYERLAGDIRQRFSGQAGRRVTRGNDDMHLKKLP